MARFGCLFAIPEHHEAPLALEGNMPYEGRVELDMRLLLQPPERCKAGQVMKVDLAAILAAPPPPVGMGARVEQHTVGVVAQFGDGMEIPRHDFISVRLLGRVAVDAVIADRAGQAMALVVEAGV
jgi:hypothetical protein